LEILGDALQKRSKLASVEKAAAEADVAEDALALEEIVTSLKTSTTAELENFVA